MCPSWASDGALSTAQRVRCAKPRIFGFSHAGARGGPAGTRTPRIIFNLLLCGLRNPCARCERPSSDDGGRAGTAPSVRRGHVRHAGGAAGGAGEWQPPAGEAAAGQPRAGRGEGGPARLETATAQAGSTRCRPLGPASHAGRGGRGRRDGGGVDKSSGRGEGGEPVGGPRGRGGRPGRLRRRGDPGHGRELSPARARDVDEAGADATEEVQSFANRDTSQHSPTSRTGCSPSWRRSAAPTRCAWTWTGAGTRWRTARRSWRHRLASL